MDLIFRANLLWSPYVIGQTIIFLPCDFYLLSFFFFLPGIISLIIMCVGIIFT